MTKNASNRPIVISVIGKAGSGKTTILKTFLRILQNQDLKAMVIEVDTIGHQCLVDEEVKSSIGEAFPKQVFDENNKINRKKLGEIVFSSKDELIKLNTITHPWIFNKVKSIINAQNGGYVILEGAALIEIGLGEISDYIFYFEASEPVRLKRLIDGRGMTKEAARKLINVQYDDDYFKKHSNMTINTEKVDNKTHDHILDIIRKLKKHES